MLIWIDWGGKATDFLILTFFFFSPVVHWRRPWNCYQRRTPAHIHPHDSLHKTVLLFTLAPLLEQHAIQSLLKATLFSLPWNHTVKMIFKKELKSRNLMLTLFPNFEPRTLSGAYCLSNRFWPYKNLNYSVRFCVLFKIISTSVAETMNCFLGELCIGFLAAFYFFLMDSSKSCSLPWRNS